MGWKAEGRVLASRPAKADAVADDPQGDYVELMNTTELASNRLLLNGLSASDLPDLCRIAGLRDIADTTISVPHPFSCTNGEDWIDQYSVSNSRIGWAIRYSSEQRLIGFIALNHIDTEHSQAEISFWIDPQESGSGVVTEAATLVINHGFEHLNLQRIEAYHMSRNLPSARVLQKLGFEKEGHLRSRVSKWGRREDVLLWSLIPSG